MSVREFSPLFSWGFSLRKSKWLVPLFNNNVFNFGNSAVNGPYGWNAPSQKRNKSNRINSNIVSLENQAQIREQHTIIDNTSTHISTETPSGITLETPSIEIADLSLKSTPVSSEHTTKSATLQKQAEAPCAVNTTITKKEKAATYYQKSDGELIDLLDKGVIRHYNLEKLVAKDPENPSEQECTRAVKVRRMYLASQIETTTQQEPMLNLPYEHYDWKQVLGACCENVVGYVPIPVGLVGPFTIDGKEYHVPMATTEGCLIASTQRGAKALSYKGVSTVLLSDGMTRGPALQMPNAQKAGELKNWLEANFDVVAKVFNSTSNYARLKEMKCAVAGRKIFVRFKCVTGDAMGMNMISKAVTKSIEFLADNFPEMQVLAVSGNFCTDKKPSAMNWIEGRGKSIVADCVVPKKVVEEVLKTTVEALVDLNVTKNLVGSALAGSIGGNNAHASNIVTAVFLATGQDAAQNVESSNCLTLMEKTEDGDLYISCSMPSIEVGTVGGGTILAPQGSMLDLLGVKGSNKQTPGANAQQLAKIVCSTVMAGELSLMSALASGDLVKAHMILNRKK